MSPNKTHTFRRTAALVCAACAGLGLAAQTLRAQTPVPAPSPSPAVPTPYSSPIIHAGGALTPPLFPLTPFLPFPDPLYSQLQGTPTGLVPGTGVNAGTLVSTEIPSFLLGDYLPASPPAAPGTYFPNHFRDGTAFSWSAPLTFLTPNAVAPATSPTGALLVPNVESTPTAVNVTEYPFIQNMQYVGTLAGTASTPDPSPHYGILATPTTPGAADAAHLIRQVVYFGRSENISTPTTTAAGTTVANTPVGAIYCVDGFTGEVIWRYQTSSYADGAVFSSPAVAYINVLTDPTTTPPTYANKAVVIAGDNNGFVYCLDAAGNGDGTSNITAAASVTGVPGTVGFPSYLPQPAYGAAAPPALLPPHVGTTGIYWAYRPDPAKPLPAVQRLPGFNGSTPLPVPGPFGIASPNIYIQPGVSTIPAVTTDPATNGKLASNAIIYLGNIRDCVYALDGIGVPNNLSAAAGPLPADNASLPGTTTQVNNQTILGTGIPDNVPTCNPRWWFTPDNGTNTGISFESTPAVSQNATGLTATIVTANPPNQVAPGTPVTFTATVSDSSGNGGLPTGSVLFSVDGTAQTPAVALDAAGAASFTPAAALTPGRHLITAAYSGDASFSASSNSPAFEEEVEVGTAAAGSIVITSAAAAGPSNPSNPGQNITFTATVDDGTGAAAPAGTVTFFIDGAAVTGTGGAATFTTTNPLSPGPHTITATYTDSTGVVTAPAASFEQYVYGLLGPVIYIGSSQELGATSNAGRIYALDGLTGPTYATTPTAADRTQRARWVYPNLYASGSGSVATTPATGVGTTLPVRPALGNISGSPVVFTNTDDVVAAVGIINTPGYIPAHPRTRIYFAANSGLEVTNGTTNTQPNPRPATDATGRVWAIETSGQTAFTTEGANTTVWSFPEANDPNNVTQDATPEPSPPMGAFLNATPAMGFVQFPSVIQYGPGPPYTPYTHADAARTTVRGQSVPMLYVGTNGTADLGFYALDVDGSTDAERGVYRLESPTGSPFTSSPVLVTNSSTSGGNGGAVYATSGNTLLQITATPISNINTAQAFPFIGVDAQFSGGGPISGPSVAAANTSDLAASETTTTTVGGVTTTTPNPFTLYNGTNATDFVYFGDGTLGFCRGITPIDANYGGAVPPTQFGGVVDQNPVAQYSNKFFLQAYLFDGTTYPGTATDMSKAVPLNGLISGFEWGGFAYVRIGNVVPPCPATDVAAPTAAELVADPTDPTLFYGNGQAVNFSVGSSAVTVPTTLLPSLTGAYPSTNGFIQRSDPITAAQATAQLQLVSESTGFGWLAAYSYPIGSANTRIGDFPGAFRRIRQATQTATTYTKNADGTYTATGTLNLIIQTTLGSQYAVGNPPTGIAQTPPSEQPTFGILNPLAVEGYGVPLELNGPQTVARPVADVYGAGPFGPVAPAAPTIQDRAAFSNGSNYIKTLPSSGYNPAKEDPTNITASLTEQADGAMVPIPIATSVGDVPDGGNGTNLALTGTGANFQSGGYGLQVKNRSLIGTNSPTGVYDATLFPALNVAMQPVNAHWNDNTTASGTTQNGPGATVNPLPWEDLSALSSVAINTSQDYPDIPASAITHTLVPTTPANGIVTGVGGPLDVRTGSNLSAKLSLARGSVSSPTPAVTDTIEVSLTPPIHQPANLQLWDGTAETPTAPQYLTTAQTTNDNIFPQGYIEGSGSGVGINASGGTPQRVFVDIGARGRFPGSAISTYSTYPYREVESFAGVPVNMKTEITNGTVSLGNGPSALGNQTEQSPLGLFDPYNVNYQTFFQPLTVLNEGNTNLLNAQFNQQLLSSTNASQTLPAYADANDPLSVLGGFDYPSVFPVTSGPQASGQRTYNGSPISLPGRPSIYEQPFLFRTSLDTDLMRAYGVNPGLLSNNQPLYPGAPNVNTLYGGATFHKPRVGVSSTTLTVPDSPNEGDPNYGLRVNNVPKIGYTAPPYVGISVPFGTPVGSYNTTDAQPLRLFEGLDPLPANATAAQAAERPFLPPTYGSVIGGHAAPSGVLATQLPLDANAQPLLPASTGVKLNINVLEDRLTDGFTVGALPMVDSQPAVSNGATPPLYTSTPDFAPAAFRDPATGNLSLYWTSGRNGGFGIYGVNAPFHLGTSNTPGSYFYPSDSTGGKWWQSVGGYTAATLNPVLPTTVASPIYSGLTVAEDPNTPGNVSAFVVAVSKTAPYNNTLYSYPVTPATASNGAITPDSFGSAAAITPPSSSSQVKYGVKGLYTGFTNPLWAFWTGSTRGRTGLYYSSQASGAWGAVNLLPVPAGLTAVADASPMLMPTYPGGTLTNTIEVTYSGTAPDGNIDLYASRYLPAGTTPATASQLNLAAFPAVTENLRAVGGWYQARDVAWSRTGALNVSVAYINANGTFQTSPLLYDTNNVPQFTKAIYDKASGLLVLTGVHIRYVTPPAAPAPSFTVNTVYVDSATGRVRFSPALLPTQNFPAIRATFSPEAKRLTTDSRADTAPVTFMDLTNKHNDAALATGSVQTADVEADRRWTIWRKSGVVGSAATLYYKAQRLTLFLPTAVDVTKPLTVEIGTTPVTIYDLDYLRGRLYFQVSAGVEGQTISVTYTDTNGKRHDGTDFPVVSDMVQWQDEQLANDNTVPPADSAAGSDTVLDYGVPIHTAVNENNVAAFLDPYAGVSGSHKVWLFWNSTRNGTADIYSETIDPRFAAGP